MPHNDSMSYTNSKTILDIDNQILSLEEELRDANQRIKALKKKYFKFSPSSICPTSQMLAGFWTNKDAETNARRAGNKWVKCNRKILRLHKSRHLLIGGMPFNIHS